MCVRNKEALIDFVFPALKSNTNIVAEDFDDRAILSTCNESIDIINDEIIEKIKKKMKLDKHTTYLSTDSVKETERSFANYNVFNNLLIVRHLYPIEFLRKVEMSGLPKHEIRLLEGNINL